jgi:hypothetical protein
LFLQKPSRACGCIAYAKSNGTPHYECIVHCGLPTSDYQHKYPTTEPLASLATWNHAIRDQIRYRLRSYAQAADGRRGRICTAAGRGLHGPHVFSPDVGSLINPKDVPQCMKRRTPLAHNTAHYPNWAVGSCGGRAACTLPSETQAFESTNSRRIAVVVLELLARSARFFLE